MENEKISKLLDQLSSFSYFYEKTGLYEYLKSIRNIEAKLEQLGFKQPERRAL